MTTTKKTVADIGSVECNCNKSPSTQTFVDDGLFSLRCTSCNRIVNKGKDDANISNDNIVLLSRSDFSLGYCNSCSHRCEHAGCFETYRKKGAKDFTIPDFLEFEEISYDKFREIVARTPIVVIMYAVMLKFKIKKSLQDGVLEDILPDMYKFCKDEFGFNINLMASYLKGAWWATKKSDLAVGLANAKIRSAQHKPDVVEIE